MNASTFTILAFAGAGLVLTAQAQEPSPSAQPALYGQPAAVTSDDADSGTAANPLRPAEPVVPSPIALARPSAGHEASPGIEADISAEMPKYDNLPAPEPKKAFKTPELRTAVDKPLDETSSVSVRKMPAYLVVGTHVFVFRNRDLYTRAGVQQITFQRHPGLVVGNVFHSNAKKSEEIFRDDEWRQTKSDYKDMAYAMKVGGDSSESRVILDSLDDEEVKVRNDAEDDSDVPSGDRFEIGHLAVDSRLLEMPEHPVDIPVVRVTW
jgi:hypothetical protein